MKENFESYVDNGVEKEMSKEKIRNNFWVKHIGLIALSAILAYVPEKKVEAASTVTESVQLKSAEDLQSQRLAAYENFKALAQGLGLDEKIRELKDLFGPALDNFLSIYNIDEDIEILKKVEDKNNSHTENIWVNKDGTQYVTLGSILSDAYTKRWERHDNKRMLTTFKGIEDIPGYSVVELKEFLDKTYPEHYIDNQVSQIEFIPEANANFLGNAEPKGFFSLIGKADDVRTPLKVYLSKKDATEEFFLYVVEHEINHASDWNNNTSLTSGERILMLKDISERIESSDRFLSEYVEGINLSVLGQHVTRDLSGMTSEVKEQYLGYIKTIEYWPEISKAYFLDKDKFKVEHPSDFAVVEKWINASSR